jgi:7,8-dihydropterin-6-yl-methyl-4-(beta-D-ribofuranosyl)aminobenzene 5'-phosphate synthase
VNTLHRVAELTNHREVHAVAGGMHLRSASDDRLRRTSQELNAFGVSVIAPSHCSGANAVAFLRRQFGARLQECTAGSRFMFPPHPGRATRGGCAGAGL